MVLLLILMLFARPAAADVAIDLEVQIAPTGKAPFNQVVHVYVQGDQVRVEDGSSGVTICDTRGGRAYRLDLARRTYRLESLDRLDASLSDRLRHADTVHVKGSVAVGSGERVVAGMPTNQVSVREEYTVDMPVGGTGGGEQGGMTSPYTTPRAPIGVPVGGGSVDDGVESPRPRDLRIEGEYWLADEGALAPLARSAALRRLFYVRTLPARALPRPLLNDLLGRMEQQGARLPLASRITVSEITPRTSIDAPERDSPMQTITTSVIRVETRPLDRMLFIVPADFHQGE